MEHCKHCIDEAMKMYSAIKSVRELHKPFEWKFTPGFYCDVCYEVRDNQIYQVQYPCPTIKALDGEQ